ncbi:MAG TPA: sodium:solute symporter family protein [Patescibacteria group bacterium]|nr:sodium:solute symporter family protein [Patescibacteria group bacterium]
MALFVFATIILASLGLVFLARKGAINDSMDDIMKASGSFGPFLLFFVSVGEIYTIGTLLGAPGAVYSKGANYGVWFFCYILLAYVVGYFLNPAVWRMGQLAKAITVADIIGWRYNSKALQVVVALIGIIFFIPLIQFQITGMGIVFFYLNLGFDFTYAAIFGAVLAFSFIALAGIRSSAYVAVLKDVLLILAVGLIGGAAAMNMPGGVEGIFRTVAQKMPQLLTVTMEPLTAGTTFTISTILFQMLGFYVSPTNLQASMSSSSAKNLRRNSIIMPMYMIMFPFLFIAAYYALVAITGLEKPDYALLAVAVKLLPNWVVGLVAGGAALTAILFMAVAALSISGLFSKNILALIKPDMKEAGLVWGARAMMALSLTAGVLLALFSPNLVANLLALGYFGFTQPVVAILFGFFWKGATKWGVLAGLVVGVAAIFLIDTVPYALNKGAVALIINLVVTVVVSLLTKQDNEVVQRFEAYRTAKLKIQSGKKEASTTA